MLPDIAKSWAGDTVDVVAAQELTIAYRPGAEVSHWFALFNKWLPIFLMVTALSIGLAAALQLQFLFETVAKFFISPLKPLLFPASPDKGVSSLIDTLAMLSWPFFIVTGLGVAIVTMNESMKATHMRINSHGLVIAKRSRVATQVSLPHNEIDLEKIVTTIPWSAVRSVQLNRKPGRRSHLDYEIILSIENHPYPGNKRQFAIRYGDIAKPFERMQFVQALVHNLPDLCPEELTEVFLSHGERESFTELWLRELTASPKRDKLIPLAPGVELQEGEYVIREKLGMGGQASVYLAESAKLPAPHNLVAVKEFILPVFPDPRVRLAAAERFHLEAEMIAGLKHPQIVRFLDLFIEDHRAYLVLERIEGANLQQLITARGALDEQVVINLALQMCDILSFLHQLQPPVAHRDFTPDNLMLSNADGLIKLIDFSVAQQVVSNVTGSVVGKLEYMAPEQFRGKPTPLSDIYSLGATLFFLSRGTEPEAITTSRPTGVGQGLADVIARATALDPAARYQSAADVKQDLLRLGTTAGDAGESIRVRKKQLQTLDEPESPRNASE